VAVDGAKREPPAGERRGIAEGKDFFGIAPEFREAVAGDEADAVGAIRIEQKFFGAEVVLGQQRAGGGAVVAAKTGGRIRVAAVADVVGEERIVVGEFS